ncbi:MAG: phospholipid methyltransferase [Rhodospirillaceae bacterium]
MSQAGDEFHGRQPHPGAWTFFKRWFADPVAMGSLVPSSASLRRLVTREIVCGPDEIVVEFGGGTGAMTRAILEAGVPAERVWSIEIDPELAGFLARLYPKVNVIHGDCREIESRLGPELIGKVGTVVLGIPMVLLPIALQREIVATMFRIMVPDRRFLHYTFCITSPLDRGALGLSGRRLGWTPVNVPPASVWGYAAAATV